MKNLVLSLMGMAALTSVAQADWVKTITYSEAIFRCKGLSPDLSIAPSVNISGGNDIDYRLPDGMVAVSGKGVSLLGMQIGNLESAPTCAGSAAGESAFSEWIKIDFATNLKLILAFNPNVSSCEYGIEQGDQIRTNIYTLTLTTADGKSVSRTWEEQAHYASPTACHFIDN